METFDLKKLAYHKEDGKMVAELSDLDIKNFPTELLISNYERGTSCQFVFKYFDRNRDGEILGANYVSATEEYPSLTLLLIND
jgi:hypothetical protein